MKIVLVALLFAASALAQNPPDATLAVCGPMDIQFKIAQNKSQHTLLQPAPGKALVYFIQDTGTARIGMDGAWVGANRGHSYFSVPVEPGEHHVCVKMDILTDHPVELLHFTAEAGQIYYFRARLIPLDSWKFLFLNAADSDEAKHLIASYALSLSHLKK